MSLILPTDFCPVACQGHLLPLTCEHTHDFKHLALSRWQLVGALSIRVRQTAYSVSDYIQTAITTLDRTAFMVIDDATGNVIGTTSFHDILPAPKRRNRLYMVCPTLLAQRRQYRLQTDTMSCVLTPWAIRRWAYVPIF